MADRGNFWLRLRLPKTTQKSKSILNNQLNNPLTLLPLGKTFGNNVSLDWSQRLEIWKVKLLASREGVSGVSICGEIWALPPLVKVFVDFLHAVCHMFLNQLVGRPFKKYLGSFYITHSWNTPFYGCFNDPSITCKVRNIPIFFFVKVSFARHFSKASKW